MERVACVVVALLTYLVFDYVVTWGEVGGGELGGELGKGVGGGLVAGAGDAHAQVVPGSLAGDGAGIRPAQTVAICHRVVARRRELSLTLSSYQDNMRSTSDSDSSSELAISVIEKPR